VRSLAEWLSFQESLHPHAIDMQLERVSQVARALELDRPPWPVITVAGTNGKGSTVSHIEALLRAAGARTGQFTSPHFLRYNERIHVEGVEVLDAELSEAFERIEAARGATTLTFFEYNTLAALAIFHKRAVDVAVLEVGLGGRLDATNLIDAQVAVLTSVGFDHRDWLGDSLQQIGAEKAGIFRAGRPAVLGSAEMPASVADAIDRIGARALIAGRDFSWQIGAHGAWSFAGLGLSLDSLPESALAGSIQYRNAATAIAAVQALLRTPGLPSPVSALTLKAPVVAQALRTVRLPGRFQVLPGEVEWILDIAHNEPAAAVFARHVRERSLPAAHGKTHAVVGILGDKDAAGIAAAMRPLVDRWFLCALPPPRGVPARELARRMSLPEEDVGLADSVEEACQRAREAAAPGDRVLVFGSVYTVGPALSWLGVY
jgi:dihydrofolate synthase/folylpolyglutamate synthase